MTGATGVIGRRVVPVLVRRGHQITAHARSPEALVALTRLGVVPVVLDLLRRDQLSSVLPGHDAVVNLATHIPSSSLRTLLPGAWRENDRIRREGSAKLVDAALVAGIGRFVQESYALVYPDRGESWIDETVPIAPPAYARTVRDAEHSAERFTEDGGVGVVLRFAAFYGPDSRFFAELVRAIRHGYAPVFGRPDAYISSVSHDDAAAAVIAALELPSGTYNVVDDEPLTHRDFVDSLADSLGVHHPRLPPMWLTPVAGALAKAIARSLRLSNRKLRDTSGWRPQFRSVREGWRDALAPFIAVTPAAAPVR